MSYDREDCSDDENHQALQARLNCLFWKSAVRQVYFSTQNAQIQFWAREESNTVISMILHAFSSKKKIFHRLSIFIRGGVNELNVHSLRLESELQDIDMITFII